MIKILILIFAVIIAALGLDAFVIEPSIIEVNTIEITDTGAELKIGLIADFQRKNADPVFVERVVDILNDKNLDAVLIAGDFIDHNLDELPSIEPLKKIKTKHGTFAVLGNHDYDVYHLSKNLADLKRAQKIIDYITDENTVTVLRNEIVSIENVEIAGLDSYWAELRDEKILRQYGADKFRILLSHNQDDLEINKNVADLFLFGHTHCGQVRLPVMGSIPKIMGFQGEYDYKHYTVNDAEVYTTCGLAPAPRFFNPTEVVIINIM